MLNIVLFGPPGAGKGTQSEKIQARYQLVHLSTGDLFRLHFKEGTELGKEAQKFMDEGNLVPDRIVIEMVDEKINHHLEAGGFIFDGFPRTVTQANSLDEMLERRNIPIQKMLSLEVPDEELRKRLLLRGQTSGRADDQNEEKINNRIRVYKEETMPVADYYKQSERFRSVNGVGSVEEIFDSICAEIDS
jgi:adenylate kinase